MEGPQRHVVWLLNHYAQMPGAPGGTRHYWLARHLRDHGWDAPIVAASVELNTGRQRLARHESRRLESAGGVTFLWLQTPPYRGNGLGRVRNMVTYALRAQAEETTRLLPRPDVVLGSSVHPLAGWAGLRLARRFRVPFVFEVRDLWPETLIQFGQISANGLSARLLRRLEGRLYRHAARIITLLPEAWRYIERVGVPRDRIVWISNGCALDRFPHVVRRGEPGKLDLMYFGAHGQANDLQTLLLAWSRVEAAGEGAGARLRLVGDGPRKPALRELAARLELRRVSFEDAIPYVEIPMRAAEADAFVLTVLDRPELYRYGVSMNKLFDYLAAGRPIIFAHGSAQNPVAEAGAGLTVPPENPEALAEAILALVRMSAEERARLGENGRRLLADRYDYAVLAARLAGLLDDVLAERRIAAEASPVAEDEASGAPG